MNILKLVVFYTAIFSAYNGFWRSFAPLSMSCSWCVFNIHSLINQILYMENSYYLGYEVLIGHIFIWRNQISCVTRVFRDFDPKNRGSRDLVKVNFRLKAYDDKILDNTCTCTRFSISNYQKLIHRNLLEIYPLHLYKLKMWDILLELLCHHDLIDYSSVSVTDAKCAAPRHESCMSQLRVNHVGWISAWLIQSLISQNLDIEYLGNLGYCLFSICIDKFWC
jgi:hypothetical protein